MRGKDMYSDMAVAMRRSSTHAGMAHHSHLPGGWDSAGFRRLSLGPSPDTKDCCQPEHSFLGFTVRCVVMVTPARL